MGAKRKSLRSFENRVKPFREKYLLPLFGIACFSLAHPDPVRGGAAPEEAELADILDTLSKAEMALDANGGPCGPVVTTLAKVVAAAAGDLFEWLSDRRNRRVIPHKLSLKPAVTRRYVTPTRRTGYG